MVTNMNRHTPHASVVLLALAAACAPGAPEPAPEPSGPLPGDNFAYVYATQDAIVYHDTRTGRESALAEGVAEVMVSAGSVDGSGVAVAYRLGDGTRVVAVDTESGAAVEVHRGDAGTTYTMRWSADGERLGVGYRPAGGGGGILVRESDGTVRDMGCSASNRFVTWRSATQAVVFDGVSYYAVNAANCATLATFSRVGKRDVTFAPNGRRAAYGQDRTVTRSGGGTVTIPELYIASHDGSGSRIIADYRSRPSHPVWSPGAGAVAYEVASARWANTTHVVIYNVGSNEYSYEASEKELGVPSDFAVCWAPDGRHIAHERVYARRGPQGAYTTRQVVVRGGGAERVVVDEIVDLPPDMVRERRDQCRWAGPAHLLVSTEQGDRVVRAADGATYAVAVLPQVALGVMVFPQER
jgi:hypothetical protein